MKINRILVPLDFSDCTPGIVRQAAELAAQLQASLLLLHVYEPPRGMTLETVIHPRGRAQGVSVKAWVEEDVLKRLPTLEAIGQELGVPTVSRLSFGPLVETILSLCEGEQVQLMVMGTHGRKGLKRVMLGSVAEEVIRRAKVPVMTVRTLHHAGCKSGACDICPSGLSFSEETLRDEQEDG